MGRIYEELPCGCLVSKDGGGGFIPCESYYHSSNEEDYSQEKLELHEKVSIMYFEENKKVQQIDEELGLVKSLDKKIDELIEAILEIDFDIEVDQGRGYIIGFQGKHGEENAKSTIREILNK